MPRDYTPSEVAEVLGVSVDTVRRWCDEGRFGEARRDGARRRIAGAALARYLASTTSTSPPTDMPVSSPRNRFNGIVTRVERSGLTALVELRSGPNRVVSLITSEALDEMGLEPGDLAVAAVKATSVHVEAPRR